MSEKTVSTEDLSKALEQLQDLAKGHNSRGTATTKVESMRDGDAGAGSDAGSTQVFHTASNSDPGTWAGSGQRKSPEDGATDGVSEDGTDYSGSAEMVKSIIDKIVKGQEITDVERALLDVVTKGGMFTNFSGTGKKSVDADKDKMDKAQKSDKKDDDDADVEIEVEKSLTDYASENEEVAKGLEVSSFLQGWAEVQAETISAVETRLAKSIVAASDEQNTFNADLAKSVAQLAEVLSIQAQRIEQIESTPARGPKSAQAVEKSFGAGGDVAPQGETLSKSQVSDALTEMVQKGELPAVEVVKFESTGMLSSDLDAKVRAHYNR